MVNVVNSFYRKKLNMKKFIFVIGVLFVLISCKTNIIFCPEFDKQILIWIPYQENDVIELYAQSNDSTILFSITSVNITHTTHYDYGTKCGGCRDEIFINDHNSDFHVEIYLHDRIMGHQSYKIIDSYFSTYSEVNNYLFESNEYDLVRIFEADNSKGTFRKLIVAKDIGVIGLIDIYGNTWALKTNVKIRRYDDPNKPRDIVINNVSC